MTKAQAFDRLRRARAEFIAARFAIRHVAAAWHVDADISRAARDNAVTDSELWRAAGHLEVTFSLRLFSEFEAILRDFWVAGLGRTTRPDMRPLMDAVGRRRQISPSDLQAAHDVRTFRNDVIHAGLLSPRLNLTACLSGLGKYLRWLPEQW